MISGPKVYELNQLVKSPKGETLFLSFGEYISLAEAKKESKNLPHWAIMEKRIVLMSEEPK